MDLTPQLEQVTAVFAPTYAGQRAKTQTVFEAGADAALQPMGIKLERMRPQN